MNLMPDSQSPQHTYVKSLVEKFACESRSSEGNSATRLKTSPVLVTSTMNTVGRSGQKLISSTPLLLKNSENETSSGPSCKPQNQISDEEVLNSALLLRLPQLAGHTPVIKSAGVRPVTKPKMLKVPAPSLTLTTNNLVSSRKTVELVASVKVCEQSAFEMARDESLCESNELEQTGNVTLDFKSQLQTLLVSKPKNKPVKPLVTRPKPAKASTSTCGSSCKDGTSASSAESELARKAFVQTSLQGSSSKASVTHVNVTLESKPSSLNTVPVSDHHPDVVPDIPSDNSWEDIEEDTLYQSSPCLRQPRPCHDNKAVKRKSSSLRRKKIASREISKTTATVTDGGNGKRSSVATAVRPAHITDSDSSKSSLVQVCSQSRVESPTDSAKPRPLVPLPKPRAINPETTSHERCVTPPPLLPRQSLTCNDVKRQRAVPIPPSEHYACCGPVPSLAVDSDDDSVEYVDLDATNSTISSQFGAAGSRNSASASLMASQSLVDLRPRNPKVSIESTRSLRDSTTSHKDADDNIYEAIAYFPPSREQNTCLSTSSQQSLSDASYTFDEFSDPDVDSSLLTNEPLYQIYHHNAVVRHVVSQFSDTYDMDSDYESSAEYESHARKYNDILSSTARKTSSTATDNPLVAGGTPSYMHLWCEMPKVKNSHILDSMSMDERRLQESQFEVISSEVSYLKSMNILVQHFMTALSTGVDHEKEFIVSRDDYNRLFSNARAVRDVSAKMVSALDQLWSSNCILDPSSLGKTVSDMAKQYFDVYIIYCSNASYQDRKLRELLERSVDFQLTLRRMEKASICQSLPLTSFLSLPMQRITRLPLLVSAICRRLEAMNDGSVPSELSHCLHVLQKVVNQCNEGARKMSNLEQIMEIERVVDFKACKKVPLVSNSRFLVKKGALQHICKPSAGFLKKTKRTLHFFLFNDILLITRKRSFRDRPYEVVDHCPHSNVHAKVLSEEEVLSWLLACSTSGTIKGGTSSGALTVYRNAFSLALTDTQKEFILSAESTSERTRWVEAFSPSVVDNEEERIYESWDCPQVQALYRFVASEPDELSFEESDIISVSRKLPDGWYEGERLRDGERGWFPASYTVEIQNAHVRSRNLREQFRMNRHSSSRSSHTT